MKRLLVTTAAAFALSTGLAFAGDPMAGYYGNTLKVEGPHGVLKIWYKADKTFSGVDGNGQTFSGTWDVAGDQLCAMQKEPAPEAGMEKRCGKVEAHKAGDSWETTAPDGQKVSLSLVAGS